MRVQENVSEGVLNSIDAVRKLYQIGQ